MGFRSRLPARVLSVIGGIGALGALAYALTIPAPAPPTRTEAARGSIPSKSPQGIDPLPARSGLRPQAGPLFADSTPAPAATAVPEHQAAPPSPPPMPYRFVGTLTREGATEHLLAKDDIVFPVQQGQTLGNSYRVEALTAQQVTVLYIPLGVLAQLHLESNAPPAGDAASAPYVIPVIRAPVVSASVEPLPAATPSAPAAATPQARGPAGTAATGTRAAHLRRELEQQLAPLKP